MGEIPRNLAEINNYFDPGELWWAIYGPADCSETHSFYNINRQGISRIALNLNWALNALPEDQSRSSRLILYESEKDAELIRHKIRGLGQVPIQMDPLS